MSVSTFGDLARAFALRQQNTNLKLEIRDLNQELATGRASDLTEHLGGSYARLIDIERDVRVSAGFKTSIGEAEQFTELMQARLEQINIISSDFARSLIAGDASQSSAASTALAEEGRQQFSTVVSMLNSEAAGRSLFSGDTTDTNALIDPADFLAELQTVVAGATTAADIETALDTWFASPAGFDAIAYTGSDTSLAPFKMSETSQVNVDIRADSEQLKDVLKGLALAAVSDAPGTTLSVEEKGALFRSAGTGLLSAENRLVELQAKLGLTQEQIENWSVRNQTEKAGLDFAKGALVAIDPFDAASKLEAAQFQLESLYAVTVRLSQLSLVNFLR